MAPLFPAPAREDALRAAVADLPDLFNEPFDLACRRLDAFIGARARELACDLELDRTPEAELELLMAARHWSPSGRLGLRWLLETLELYGAAERRGRTYRFDLGDGGRPAAAIRAEAEAALPGVQPAYEVLELASAALPDVLAGRTRGEDVLFGAATMGLWFDYFSNHNIHYAPSNAITAEAVARVAAAGASVMEVGGGGGSAAQAVLAALQAAGRTPRHYLFTELHPAFLRRGTRSVQAVRPDGCSVEATRYDLDRSPGEQGVAGPFDAVVAVNALHLARDPVASLRFLHGLLAPGGALVLGELIRPPGDRAVHLELPFTLLEAYRDAPVVPGVRNRPGFLTEVGWRRALGEAGFAAVNTLPCDLDACLAAYPGFYCAAVIATA